MMNPELGLVYVVDDDASVRRSIERLAQSMGLEARGFATGLEFLAARREPRRACVVLDQRLPDMHGLDVQRQLARTDPGDEFSRREALAARAVAFLAKPFDDNSLREAIWRSLGGKPR
jgi:FixJ family two-component response regulator